MAFVNPNILAQIFGQEGAINTASPNRQQAMINMLAGAGAGMTQAANQPGANFAQALGGGAQGMVQGQQQAQQMQMNQMQISQAQREMERQERLSKIMGDILQGPRQDWASQVATGPVQQPQLTGAQATPLQPRGALSAQFESGGDPTAVSSGRGDPGGRSFGRHQLASGPGTMASFLQSPEGQPFAQQFQGLDPSSEQFGQRFQQVSQQAGPEFEQAQRQFLERTHVQPVMTAAQRAGLPVDNPAVQEALFSQAVQHSGEGNLQILNDAVGRVGANASPERVIDALYDAREPYAVDAIRRNGERQGLDPEAIEQTIEGVRNRYRQERQQAKAMLGKRQVGGPLGGQPAGQDFSAQVDAQPQNGYQQIQRGSGGQLNLPPQAAQLLSLMPPEKAASALWDLQTRTPADMPAEVRELMWAFDGDEEAARQAWHAQQQADAQGDQDQRDRKIRDYQELYGVDRNQATAMADGLIKPVYNEQLGRTVLIDSRDPNNPRVREVEIAPASQISEEEKPEETLFDIAQRGNIAGLVPSAADTLGRVTGQAGFLTEGQKQAAEDRQTVMLTNRSLIRALQDSPMYAQREREAIEREIGINPSAFDSQEGLLARMRAVHGVLERRLAEAKRIEADPRMGDDIRRQAQKSARDIESYLNQMGNPPSEGGTGQADPEVDALIDRWAD